MATNEPPPNEGADASDGHDEQVFRPSKATEPAPSPEPIKIRTATGSGITERRAVSASGWFGVLIILACIYYGGTNLAHYLTDGVLPSDPMLVTRQLVVPLLLFFLISSSLVIVSPMETRVLQFFGKYVGTVRRTGLVWTLPFTTRRTATVRVRNFETRVLKVNDAEGNPVEFAAVVVWQVRDTARAVFAVDDAPEFVTVQAEAALRHVAVAHPYDDITGRGTSLRGSTDLVAAALAREVGERVSVAGVEVLEVRISHLAYATEIAQAMLQRQQASAIVAARATIVDGAVGMVEQALARLAAKGTITLDEDRKAVMVSNLLVVLCGDSRATPVVNAGTLYQ